MVDAHDSYVGGVHWTAATNNHFVDLVVSHRRRARRADVQLDNGTGSRSESRYLWPHGWLIYLGPSYVRRFGEDRISHLWVRQNWSANGGALVWNALDPFLHMPDAKTSLDYPYVQSWIDALGPNTVIRQIRGHVDSFSRAQTTLGDMELMVPVQGGVVWTEQRRAEGAAVVMLHPGWGDSSIWDGVVSRLPESARTVRYDAPGYGRSPAPAGPFTALADLVAVLDRLDIREAIVVGHSGGGATALGLALAQPERVRSLILVAPGLGDCPWPVEDPYLAEFDGLFAAGDMDGLVGLGTRTWAAAGDGPEVEAQMRSGVKGMFAQGDLLNPDPPAFNRLPEIHVPTSLVIGDLDHPMLVDCANAIGALLVGCRVIAVHGADHMLPLRVPQRLAELIAAALIRCS